MKLIIDTDIGSDIDDALAIAYAVRSGYDIPLITTVHGKPELRAKAAKKLVDLLGVDIPIAIGEAQPLKQKHIFWYGYECAGLLEETESVDMRGVSGQGVEALIETIRENAGNIAIAAIGPLTNIARAFQKAPDLPRKLAGLYMIGSATLRNDEFIQTYRAHNFKVDPEAVDIVFSSKVSKTLITTSVAKQLPIARAEMMALGINGPVGNLLARGTDAWLTQSMYTDIYLYDPLVVAHHTFSDLTEKVQYLDTSITTHLRGDFKKLFFDTVGDENHGH